ncbi:DUF6160 family protein [Hydrocarboniclastica marina]|uniref:DUF6160 domain-containing protein n=1 Tax=Hydrocarboniclastica marina TaxID=2259620 RepID=A0A4P7XGT3_9ALTE|nr:DUF6160 family protein [Hydrocarboniclastica marina]QCF26229.1 hypothetical protein soil367_09960 [Hydrocarboniclastica marina]
MKGLKRIALVAAISATSFTAQAEFSVLDDVSMADVTGQAGVTIDLSANVSIKEIAYEDQGFLVINGLRLGGHSGEVADYGAADALDNLRLTVDVAGKDELADLGNNGVFAQEYQGYQGSYLDADGNPVYLEYFQNVSDGDLVISLRSQDGNPVDFGLAIGSVSLARQEGNANNVGYLAAANPDATVLVSDMQIDGYLGPIDVVVQEESNSMNINAYFTAAGEMTLPFMGTSLGFELHNRRGQSSVIVNGAGDANGNVISYAHAQVDVGVVEGYFTNGEDALGIWVQDFSGDLDLTDITMGNGASIGSIYMTDLTVTGYAVVYGH